MALSEDGCTSWCSAENQENFRRRLDKEDFRRKRRKTESKGSQTSDDSESAAFSCHGCLNGELDRTEQQEAR